MSASSNGPRYAPEDPTLPKPWRGLIDGKTGYLYFWNPETNVTQYERPVAKSPSEKLPPPPPPKANMSVSSSVHVQYSGSSRHGQHRDSKEEGRDTGSRSHHHPSQRGGSGSQSQSQANGVAMGLHGAAHGHSHGLTSQFSRSSTKQVSSDLGGGLSVEAYRRQHEITILGDNVPEPHLTFESAGFPSEILREVQHAGFSSPTPIQAQSWPVAMQSRDLIAVAKTGSGKTLGYLFPGFMHLNRLRNNPKTGPTVLVLAPTRELATQILDEAVKFGRSSRISSTCLYGGAPKGPQLRDVDRGVDVVVATPGRLNDILEMRRISLKQVSYLVLDEADRMLDMGFEPQIRKIVKEIPSQRQTLMFTATWPKEVRKIAADLLVKPVQVNIGSIDELVANKAITQYVELITPIEKQRRLEQILRSQEPGSKVLIFCSTKRMCDQLSRSLTRQFGAAAIHGDKSQHERDLVLGQFRSGRSPILVATDVAARGLDIKDIRVVINYDFPTGIEDYVHRIGRTGRAGATGVSYTFFSEQDSKHASDLVKVLEGAGQRVPREIRDMSSRGGGGRGKFRRWAAVSSNRNGGRSLDSGYGHSERGMEPSTGRLEDDRNNRGLGDRDRYDRDKGFSSQPVDTRGRDLKIPMGTDDRREGERDVGRVRSRSPVTNKGRGVGSKRSRSRSRSRDRRRSPARRSRSRSRGRQGAARRSRSRSRGRGHSPTRRSRSPARRSRSRSLSRGRQAAARRSRSRSRDRGRSQERRNQSRSRSRSRGHRHLGVTPIVERSARVPRVVPMEQALPDGRARESKEILPLQPEKRHSLEPTSQQLSENRSSPELMDSQKHQPTSPVNGKDPGDAPIYDCSPTLMDKDTGDAPVYDFSPTCMDDRPRSPRYRHTPSPRMDGLRSPTRQSPGLKEMDPQSPTPYRKSPDPEEKAPQSLPYHHLSPSHREDLPRSPPQPMENGFAEPVQEPSRERPVLPINSNHFSDGPSHDLVHLRSVSGQADEEEGMIAADEGGKIPTTGMQE